MKLYIIRHGETDENVKGIIQGWLDTSLNKRGKNQAMELAESFNEDFDVIYSSDLLRATQTASFFREKFPNKPYYEDSRLRERNFGEVTGRLRSKVGWGKIWSSPADSVPLPGVETLNEYNERVQDFIDMLRKTKSQSVLVVTHSGTINRIRDLVSGEEHAKHANASILEVDI